MSDRGLATRTNTVFGDVGKGTKCRVCSRDVTDNRMKYCSEYCRNIARAVMSLLNWTSVRTRILDRDDHTCQECGFREDWLHRGIDQIRERVEEILPERPPAIPMSELSEWDRDSDTYKAFLKERIGYNEAKNGLEEQYFNGKIATAGDDKYGLEVDHITPISQGGHPFDPANLRTLCKQCHRAKTADDLSERPERRPSAETVLGEFVTDGGDQG